MCKKMNEKIYIRMIDGAMTYIPVSGEEMGDNKYKLLDINEYDPQDSSCILEFYPGDIVRVEETKIGESKDKSKLAVDLVSGGDCRETYSEFIFIILSGKTIDNDLRNRYNKAIEMVQKEIEEDSKFHYPDVKSWIERNT